MSFGIRAKFIGILVLATVLPLVIAGAAVYLLGNKYYRDSEGKVFRHQAEQMATFLSLSVNGYNESMHDWLALSDFHSHVQAANRQRESREPSEVARELRDLHQAWPDLDEDSDPVRELMENDMARALHEFQELNPLFAEIFITDEIGRLLATSDKTTNYYHAPQTWWQRGMREPFRSAYIEGVNFDESAGVYSFDLIIPIRDWRDPEKPPAGVAKAVVNASPLFFDLARTYAGLEGDWRIVLENGTILFSKGFLPLERRLSAEAVANYSGREAGWILGRLLNDEENEMAGFAQLPWESRIEAAETESTEDAAPLYVIVHQGAAEVFAPVRGQMALIAGAGGLLIVISTLIGYYLAQYHMIRPINALQAAAQNISASAKLKKEEVEALSSVPVSPSTRKLLERIQTFQSGDEISELARDFSSMATRVLSYHEQLESEINAKMAEVQGDLRIAREFQEALMPHNYPQVPTDPEPGSLNLHFNHIYKPASTVGGDFFNVLKLSENRAAIFVADVMGHGARSALVTAIVATLLHDLAPKTNDPGRFMQALNEHLHHLIKHSKQVIFVTAFYLVIDTRDRRATFASAGHPSPLLVQRRREKVRPLISPVQNDSALGLLEDSTYSTFTRDLHEDDLFLLFTDGLFEVLNPEGEEFGLNKLVDVVTSNMQSNASEISNQVLETVNRFGGATAQHDDICLVSVELSGDEPSDSTRDAREPAEKER